MSTESHEGIGTPGQTSRDTFGEHAGRGAKPTWRSAVHPAAPKRTELRKSRREKRERNLSDDDMALYKQALDLRDKRDNAQALEIIEGILNRGERDTRLYAIGALCALDLEQFETAVNYWKDAVRMGHADTRMAFDILNFLGRHDAAITQQIRDSAQDSLDLLVFKYDRLDRYLASQYSGHLEAMGNLKDQLRVLKHAIRLDRADQRIFMKASSILRGDRRYEEAAELLEIAVERHCGDAKIYMRLAHLYEHGGEPEKATAVLETCLERGKHNDQIVTEHNRLTASISHHSAEKDTPTNEAHA